MDPILLIGEVFGKANDFQVICTCENAIANDKKKKRKMAEERLRAVQVEIDVKCDEDVMGG